MTERELRARVRWRVAQQLPLLVALVVLWMLLWGAINPLNLITGIVLALVVTRFLYLPHRRRRLARTVNVVLVAPRAKARCRKSLRQQCLRARGVALWR